MPIAKSATPTNIIITVTISAFSYFLLSTMQVQSGVLKKTNFQFKNQIKILKLGMLRYQTQFKYEHKYMLYCMFFKSVLYW